MPTTLQKLTILSLSLLLMGTMAVAPILGAIAHAFPGASPTAVQMLIALPGAVLIPFSILSGGLSARFSKRGLVMLGLVVFIMGGVAPAFSRDFSTVMWMRVLFGAGLGILTPFASGLIADFFEGPQRSSLLGFQGAVVNTGSILMSLMAGILGAFSWRYGFYVYLIGLPILVLIFAKLPEPPKAANQAEKAAPNGKVFRIAFLMLLYALCYFTFFSNTAILIDKERLGDAASSGIAITLMTVGGLCLGVVFGRIHELMGRFIPVLGLLLTGAGFLILTRAHSLPGVFLAALVIGAGFGIVMVYMTLRVTLVAPKPAVTISLAIMLSFVNIGAFISPPVFIGLGKALHNPSERFTFLLTAFFLFAAALIASVKQAKTQP